MRTSHAATALAAFAAGLTAAAALRHRPGRRGNGTAAAAPALPPAAQAPEQGAVVLPFARPVVAGPVPTQPESPARCGDSGGRTRAGAPCGARTTTGARCRHHPIAA